MERQSRACYVLSGSMMRIRLDVGQADARRALEGARGFLLTGVDAPAFIGPGQREAAWNRLLLHAGFAQMAGTVSCPWSPEGSQQPVLHVDRFAGVKSLTAIVRAG